MQRILLFTLLSVVCQTFTVRSQVLSKAVTSKKICLTFDACMTTGMLKKLESGSEKPLYNEAIIEYLHQEKIPATIFISGLWAEKYPEAVKTIASDPLFEIGNHSYSHRAFTDDCYSLPTLPQNEKRDDIRKTQDVLTQLSGRKPSLFRFPGGCYHAEDLTMVSDARLKVVGWTFASGDAFNPNAEAIIENVLRLIKPGAIVVFHLAGNRYAPKTAEVIKAVIPELKKRGYEFVTVSTLLKQK